MRLLSSKQGAIFFGKETGRVFNLFILFCEIGELAVVCVCSSIPKLNRSDISQKCTIMMPKYKKFQSLQKKGTGNREQVRNTHLHQFKAQLKKRCFLRCVARKKTVSLFQSHVFKHEFFLLESCPFPVPSEFTSANWMILLCKV